MLTKEFIVEKLQEIIKDNYFIVDVKVSPKLNIKIHLDNKEGVKLRECRIIHKQLYKELETKTETFDLEISSPGLTNDLKVWKQYEKLISKQLNIVTTEGESFTGELLQADEKQIEIKRSKQKTIQLSYDKIKRAKQFIKL